MFRILSHLIAPDSTSNVSNNTGRQGTSNHTLKICLVNLSIEKNDNNAITVGKAANALMKVIHVIGGYSNKFRIEPWESKEPNLKFLKYFKGGKYPEVEVGK